EILDIRCSAMSGAKRRALENNGYRRPFCKIWSEAEDFAELVFMRTLGLKTGLHLLVMRTLSLWGDCRACLAGRHASSDYARNDKR
ncbi:MAG: hypothetical protein Q8R07_05435, partial [Candidatus Uhrbacteria bacterium]|nr:hypothetical protein [Candidatus Uhrbacteria bacterium]